jgi:dienelactone hydrolase
MLEPVSYEADGVRMIGQMAVAAGPQKRPGVLVAHESFGLTSHALSVAQRLADLGYVAFALDYQGGGVPLHDRDEMMRRFRAFMADPSHIRRRTAAALEILRSHPLVDVDQIAFIGYCYGGTAALELARSGADLKAVVGFHSGLTTVRPQDAVNIKGKVLVCIGADDPFVPPAERLAFEKEMTEAKVDWRLNLYGGAVHSFTNPEIPPGMPPGFAYDARADERSWRAMIDLLDETLL